MQDTAEIALSILIDNATAKIDGGAVTEPSRFIVRAPSDRDAATIMGKLSGYLAFARASVRAQSALAPDTLIVTLPERVFNGDVAAAFEAAYGIADLVGAAEAEPELPFVSLVEPATVDGAVREAALLFPGCWAGADPGLANRPRWALEALAIEPAWAYSRSQGRPVAGKGIVIAHLDTGLARHAELDGAALLPGEDLVDEDTDATDPLGYRGNPGHGTSTASVIVSPASQIVYGAAPAASLMPIRCIRIVTVVWSVRIAEAIDRAVARGAHVITMSLGGLPSFALERSLRRAVDADVLVLAAAGNCVGLVVYPAADPNCLAVGGSNAASKTWRGSCSGAEVDICAPAENVFRAAVTEGGGQTVGQGEGTSYAVALTAGVAACWLAHHGRARVIEAARARGETVNAMFRRLARATATVPAGWDPLNFGSGIVNARALLEAPFDLGIARESAIGVAAAGAATRALNLALSVAKDPAVIADAPITPVRNELVTQIYLRRRGAEEPVPVSGRLAEALGQDGLDTLNFAGGQAVIPVPAIALPALAEPSPIASLRREFARKAPGMEGMVHETTLDAAELPHADDVLGFTDPDNIDAFLDRFPPGEIADRDAVRRALALAGGTARRGYAKIKDPLTPSARVTRAERVALEAVIQTDGSRPSILLRDNAVPPDHPMIGSWKGDIHSSRLLVEEIAPAVCRIQPAQGGPNRFFGSGSLVDRGRGLVLTNFHVLQEIKKVATFVQNPRDARRINIYGGAFVDFDGEVDKPIAATYRVVEAIIPVNAGMTSLTVDAAVLRIMPVNAAAPALPAPVRLSANPNSTTGAMPSFCTIGFPAAPERTTGVHEDVDWDWVTRTLFGGLFGLKRLAPGVITAATGTLDTTYHASIFKHDATTLGGSSGSLCYAWKDQGAPGVGLHFAGKTRAANEAHSLAAIAAALREIGVSL